MVKQTITQTSGRAGVACQSTGRARQGGFFGARTPTSGFAPTPKNNKGIVVRHPPYLLYSIPNKGSMEIVGDVIVSQVLERNKGRRMDFRALQVQYENELVREVRAIIRGC